MAAIMISVVGINCENLSCNKRGVHVRVYSPGNLLTWNYLQKPFLNVLGKSNELKADKKLTNGIQINSQALPKHYSTQAPLLRMNLLN